uniref:Lipid droplet-associated hydrolase n=1 Tax=Caenorhabditis japonica TaxID=281687 RepID=A0A8R1DWE9_CAEJA
MSFSIEEDERVAFDRRVRGSVNMIEIERIQEWVEVMGTTLTPEILVRENQGEKDNRIVIFLIPGNPGNDGFYTDFGRRLIRNLIAREDRLGHRRVQFLFYTISHLNHVLLPTELRCSESHKVNERFSLLEQVQHKLDFVKEYLPRGNRVYMFGHGAGAYMLLSILPYIKDDFNLRKAIGSLDESLLFHKNLVYFYYGVNDGWCPIEHGEAMSQKLTRGHVVIDKDNVEHSFVFRDAATMAEKVLQFIV